MNTILLSDLNRVLALITYMAGRDNGMTQNLEIAGV